MTPAWSWTIDVSDHNWFLPLVEGLALARHDFLEPELTHLDMTWRLLDLLGVGSKADPRVTAKRQRRNALR